MEAYINMNEINDSLVSNHNISLARSQTFDAYLAHILSEVVNSLSQPLPTPFDLPVQYQASQGYNGQLDNVTYNYFHNSTEVVHNGTVNPVDLYRQADHACETPDAGVEIKEEYGQEDVQEGVLSSFYQ